MMHLQWWLAAGAVLAWGATYVNPDALWPAAFGGIAIPALFMVNFLFCLWWLSIRSWYALLPAGVLVMLGGSMMRILQWNIPEQADAGETTLRVVTCNVHGLRHVGTNETVPLEEPAQLLQQLQPDLLCIQEFPRSPQLLERFSQMLYARTPIRHRYADLNGNFVLFSAFPILQAETHYFPNRTNGYQQADIQLGARRIRVFNVHLQSNSMTRIAERVATQGNLQDKQTWLDIGGIMERYRYAARLRARQAKTMAQLIAQSDCPVLLLGDCNDTPLSYTWQTLTAQLSDTFMKKGRGLGVTYAGHIPGLRIDYIMATPGFRVLEHCTIKQPFSDHRAVWASVGIANDTAGQ